MTTLQQLKEQEQQLQAKHEKLGKEIEQREQQLFAEIDEKINALQAQLNDLQNERYNTRKDTHLQDLIKTSRATHTKLTETRQSIETMSRSQFLEDRNNALLAWDKPITDADTFIEWAQLIHKHGLRHLHYYGCTTVEQWGRFRTLDNGVHLAAVKINYYRNSKTIYHVFTPDGKPFWYTTMSKYDDMDAGEFTTFMAHVEIRALKLKMWSDQSTVSPEWRPTYGQRTVGGIIQMAEASYNAYQNLEVEA